MPPMPALSVVADKARAFRKLDWQAESTIALQPDLVFVGPNDRSMTRRMLTSQGLRVVETGFVSDLDSARKQIREMAELLGQKERGEKLLADLERARSRLAAAARKGGETALVVERGGYTQGPSSLAATLLSEAGLKPPAGAPAGYGGFIPLEKFLMLEARPGFPERSAAGGDRSGRDVSRSSGDARPLSAGAARRAADALHHVRRPGPDRGLRLHGGRDGEIAAPLISLSIMLSENRFALFGMMLLPFADDRNDGIEAIGERGGPRLQDQGDLISRSQSLRTAGTASKPGRALTFAGTNFLPHQEPMMMSGAARDHGVRRDDAFCRGFHSGQFGKNIDAAGDLDQFRHPADAGNHRLVPFLEIDARPVPETCRGGFHANRALPAAIARAPFALSFASTSAPSVSIIARMPARSR